MNKTVNSMNKTVNSMNKTVLIYAFCLCFFLGCTTSNQEFIVTMNESLEVIIPHHIKYLKEDSSLKKEEQIVMIKTSQEVLELSRVARKENE